MQLKDGVPGRESIKTGSEGGDTVAQSGCM